MKFPFCICLFPLVFALFHPALAEGNTGSLDFEQRINGKAVLKTIEPIRERLQDLSAVFFSGHDVVIYGIVLSPDGYIATKASELHSYRDLTSGEIISISYYSIFNVFQQSCFHMIL